MRRNVVSMLLFFVALKCVACGAAQVDLAKARTATITTLPSETHELYAVFIYQQEDDLVIYGKIKKTQGFCITPGHIDVAIVGKGGEILSSFGIPIERRAKERPGWFGAHYRARIPLIVPHGTEVRLAFHGEHCYRGMTFDVEDNVAITR
jgi:hypothetical protein